MKSYYDPNAVVKATVNIFFSVNRQQLQFSTLYKQSQGMYYNFTILKNKEIPAAIEVSAN